MSCCAVGTWNCIHPWPWEFGMEMCRNWIWDRGVSQVLGWYNWKSTCPSTFFLMCQETSLIYFTNWCWKYSTESFPMAFWEIKNMDSLPDHYCCCLEQGSQLHLHTFFLSAFLSLESNAVSEMIWKSSMWVSLIYSTPDIQSLLPTLVLEWDTMWIVHGLLFACMWEQHNIICNWAE